MRWFMAPSGSPVATARHCGGAGSLPDATSGGGSLPGKECGMSRFTSRVVLVTLLLLYLGAGTVRAAKYAGRPEAPRTATTQGHGSLAKRAWGFFQRLWAPEGSSLDPF